MTQTIDRRARELLAKQYEGTEYAKVLRKGKSNKYLDSSDIKALAALTEALTRVEELEWRPIESLPDKGDVLVGCWSENIDGSYSWEFVELVRLEAKGHDDTVLNINSSNFTHIIKHSTHWRCVGSTTLSKGITE